MRKLVCILVLLVVATAICAQDALQASRHPDDSIRRASRPSVDSIRKREIGFIREQIRELDRTQDDYIEPQHYEWTVMLQATRTFENFVLRSNGQSIMLAPDGQTKLGPYIGWRWFFLGYTIDIKNLRLFEGGLLEEFDFSIYSSKLGVDVFHRNSGSDYKIRDVELGGGIDGDRFEGLPFSGVSVGMTGVNAYYIFNHRHFSYPAAFSQSTCQKISCGSWMAGLGYIRNTLELDHKALEQTLESRMDKGHEVQLDSGMMFNSVKYSDFSLSAGYAYNWVFARDWLFCSSAQMAVSYKTSNGDLAEEKNRFDISKFNPDFVGRFAVVYNNTRWYAGLSAIFRTNNYSTSRFKMNNIFGTINAYVGYNFVLKKKYRKKK